MAYTSYSKVNKYYLTSKISPLWEEEKKGQYKKLLRALNKDVFQWSIVLKENNKCIGQISVQENGDDKSIRDIGWFVDPNFQRKGFAYEAASEILKYMFKEVKISKIITSAAVINFPSWHLMEKLGFKKIENKEYINHYTYGGDELSWCYEITSDDIK